MTYKRFVSVKKYLKNAKPANPRKQANDSYESETQNCVEGTQVPLNEWYKYRYAYFLRNLRPVTFEEMDCRELVKLLDYTKDISCVKEGCYYGVDGNFQFLYVYAMKSLQAAPVIYNGYLVYYNSKIRFRKLKSANEAIDVKEDDGLIDNLLKYAYCYANYHKLMGVSLFYHGIAGYLGSSQTWNMGTGFKYEIYLNDIDECKKKIFNSSMLKTMKDVAPNFISTGRMS